MGVGLRVRLPGRRRVGKQRRPRRMARRLAVSALGLAASTVGAAYYLVRRLTQPANHDPRGLSPLTPLEVGLPYEPRAFSSRDGLVLAGWWFPRPDDRRIIIGCHGYRGSKSDLLGIAALFWRHGYNVLLFDHRGHGESAPAPITLGYAEVADLSAAIDTALQRVPGGRVGVIGFSMGAAVAILTAAHDPRIRAVVADSAFARQSEVVAWRLRQATHLPPGPILAVADRLLKQRAGFRFRDVIPEAVIGQIAPRPILLIHGRYDRTVPVSHAYRLYAAAGQPKDLWVAPAGHCGVYFLDRALYSQRIRQFFDQALRD